MELAQTDNGRHLLVLPPILDLTGAQELKRVLLQGLEAERGLDVDCARVRKITSPCLQVLLAAFKSAGTGNDAEFRLKNPSAEFDATVETLGLKSAFGVES